MIVELFMKFLHGLASALVSFLGSAIPSPPSFWAEASDAVSSAVAVIPGPVRHLVPIVPALVAGTAVVALVVVLGGVRFARRVLSIFTGGGGMA